jgi:hypothetical protein
MADFGTWVGVGVKPSLASVVVTGNLVRATFSEAMLNNSDFIDPTHYVFTVLDGLSVAVTAIGVTPGPGVNPTYVDITLDKSMTIGVANYRLTVSTTLKDKASNPIDPAGRTQDFNGNAVRTTITAQSFPTNLERVQVTYSKAVKQTNPADLDDALRVANYSISGGVLVSGVASLSSSVVVLQVSGQQNGHTYVLTVLNVKDLSKNEVAP